VENLQFLIKNYNINSGKTWYDKKLGRGIPYIQENDKKKVLFGNCNGKVSTVNF
jgi:hypothetical protein